jgi:hypothetical protein
MENKPLDPKLLQLDHLLNSSLIYLFITYTIRFNVVVYIIKLLNLIQIIG